VNSAVQDLAFLLLSVVSEASYVYSLQTFL